jgi:hypothetical protein
MEIMLVPSIIEDYEVCDLLLDLTAQDAAKFCQDDIEVAIILTNVLSARMISDMFALMPEDTVSDVIEQSSNFKKSDLTTQIPKLKDRLMEVKMKRDRSPFILRMFDLLPTAKPEIEKKLYASLLKHVSLEDIKFAAIKHLPSELAKSIPDSIYKLVVSAMPLELQVQYFASMNDEDRKIAMDRFASAASKGREMIELEVKTLTRNEIALRKLQTEKKSAIDFEFLTYTRKIISTNQEAQKEILDVVDQWLNQLKDGSSADESIAA